MKYLTRKQSYIFLILLISFSSISWGITENTRHRKAIKGMPARFVMLKAKGTAAAAYAYDSLHLDDKGLSRNAFDYAVHGYQHLEDEGILKNDSVITIIDFDQPSYNKRMYVIDVKNYKILYQTWTAHGKNSGQELATDFSNRDESNKSSLGFYITDKTYYGSKGYSLKLVGLEKNINDHALQRAIVLHGAAYVSQSTINEMGFLGRSHGCPAVAQELSRPIINLIKDGSCLFIYNKQYKPSAGFSFGS